MLDDITEVRELVERLQRERDEALARCQDLESLIGKSLETAWRAGYGEAVRRAAAGEPIDEQQAWESVDYQRLVKNWSRFTSEPEK